MESHLQVDSIISHYRILSLLGKGGMGEVYLAEDTTLGRKVAIKLLPAKTVGDENARRRLIREAQAAATLDHPNICPVYEAREDHDRTYIVMQYIEGEDLARRIHGRPLELREALTIALQIADALEEAHSHGVIHRDLKPQNVMITPRGQAKLLDFGLAKIVMKPATSALETHAATRSMLTAPGIIVGTLPYMSPEQARGEELDGRSDVYSLGAVTYEMLSGVCPFAAPTEAEIISAVLTREPPRLTGESAVLQRTLSKALAKDRTKRHQTASDLSRELRRVLTQLERGGKAGRGHRSSAPGTATAMATVVQPGSAVESGGSAPVPSSRRRRASKAINSLAVMPLSNATADPAMDYLSDGITESLINKLAQLPRMRVMARATVFRYKGRELEPLQIGRDLNVRAVLMGRVQERGDRLIISAELVNTSDGSHIWGEQYNRPASDIFDVQEEIANRISDALQIRLTSEEKRRLEKRHTANAEAYQFYLKGLFQMNKGTIEGALKGIEFYSRAIETDPMYALAYSGLANSYVWLSHLALPPREAMPKAKAAATRALEIDESVVEAHAMLALVKMEYDRDWEGAEAEFKRALELDPNHSAARRVYGFFLTSAGRFDEALAEYAKAREFDPLSLLASAETGWSLYQARHFDRAIEYFQKTLELEPHFYMASWGLASAYVLTGEFSKASAEFERMLAATGGQGWELISGLAHCHAVSGNRAKAQELLDQLIEQSKQYYVAPLYIAQVYAGLGETDSALEWLEEGYEDRFGWLVTIKWGAVWDPLRAEPRFQDLSRRLGPQS